MPRAPTDEDMDEGRREEEGKEEREEEREEEEEDAERKVHLRQMTKRFASCVSMRPIVVQGEHSVLTVSDLRKLVKQIDPQAWVIQQKCNEALWWRAFVYTHERIAVTAKLAETSSGRVVTMMH